MTSNGREQSTQVLWTLVGATLLTWAFELENSAESYRWVALLALVGGFWGLLTAIVSRFPAEQTTRWRVSSEVLAWMTAGLVIACIATWSIIQLHVGPNYGTDELAFDQYAAQLVQHGFNPYTHSMGPAFPMFRVSPGGYTFTLTGARVTQLSYPALSFLAYLPPLVFGWSRQLAPGSDVIGWSVAVVMMFWMLPRGLRPAALILGSLGVYVSLSTIGLTDMVFMPLLVVAAYRWDRFDGHNWRTYLGPVMFGLAMAGKQTPWPILPFILVALVCDEQSRAGLRAGAERAGRYLAAALVAFLIPNLPFIVMSPSAWVDGTMAPLVKSLVPAGQGAVGVSLFLRLGGGSLLAFTLVALVMLLFLLVSYIGTYPLLKPATFVLPAIGYFFAVRSYAIYLVALVPPSLVAATTSSAQLQIGEGVQNVAHWLRSRRWGMCMGALAAVTVAIGIYALADGAPLSLRITHVQLTGSGNAAKEVTVRVTNNSGSAARPSFTMQTPSGVTSFWHVARGPVVLKAGATARYRLLSPDLPSEPSVTTTGLTVLAFLSNPASVSVSEDYSPPIWHVGFDPESVDQIQPIGSSVTLHIQLLDDLDAPISRAGVPIVVSQGSTKHQTVATINAHLPGHAAKVLTNAKGVATVTITDVTGGPAPLIIYARPPNAKFSGYLTVPSSAIQIRFDGH